MAGIFYYVDAPVAVVGQPFQHVGDFRRAMLAAGFSRRQITGIVNSIRALSKQGMYPTSSGHWNNVSVKVNS